MSVEEIWVLVGPCILTQAFSELIVDGVPEIHPFPPADPTMPAATVLSIAGSSRVRKAGIRMVLDERVLQEALATLRQLSVTPRPSDVRDFDNSIRQRLGSALEPADPLAGVSLDDVIRDWAPNVIVASDQVTRRRYAADFPVVRPGQWVGRAMTLSRAL